MENAKKYILEHGINPPKPRHLKGRAIGMWHSKMSKLRKSLFLENASQEEKLFDNAVSEFIISQNFIKVGNSYIFANKATHRKFQFTLVY